MAATVGDADVNWVKPDAGEDAASGHNAPGVTQRWELVGGGCKPTHSRNYTVVAGRMNRGLQLWGWRRVVMMMPKRMMMMVVLGGGRGRGRGRGGGRGGGQGGERRKSGGSGFPARPRLRGWEGNSNEQCRSTTAISGSRAMEEIEEIDEVVAPDNGDYGIIEKLAGPSCTVPYRPVRGESVEPVAGHV